MRTTRTTGAEARRAHGARRGPADPLGPVRRVVAVLVVAPVLFGGIVACREDADAVPSETRGAGERASLLSPEEQAALLADAKRAEEEGELDAAIATLERVVAEGAYDEGARYRLGQLLVEHASVADVVAYYARTVAGDPKPQTSYYFWGRALAKAGDVDGAIGRYRKALEVDPAHELSELAWGELLERRGDAEGALAHYTRATEIHPEFRDALRAAARVLERLGRTDEAEAYRARAKTADPMTPMRFLYWARALLAADRPAAAVAELERAVRAMPDNEEARRLLAETRAALRE